MPSVKSALGLRYEIHARLPNRASCNPRIHDSRLFRCCGVNQIAVGYCELVSEEDDLVIEKLFVDPNFMGQGIGRALLDSMMDYATRHSADRILIASDPDAEQFYLSMGARRIGQTPSESIEGRLLPLLEICMNR